MPRSSTLASILITPIYLAKFTNGEWLGLYAFIAAIIGGFNQVRGAIVGGAAAGRDRQFRRRLSSPRNTGWRYRC